MRNRYYKSEAIVLNSIKFGEGHKIVNLFTRELGKIETTAFGARKTRSRFGSLLEPFSHIKVLMYRKSEDVPYSIKETEPIDLHPGLREEYIKIISANAIIEPFVRLVHKAHPDKRLFYLLKCILCYLESCSFHTVFPLLSIFEIKFVEIMGYGIQTVSCQLCRSPIGGGEYFFDPSKGFPVCIRCASKDSFKIGYETIRFINWVKKLNITDNSFLDTLKNVRIGKATYINLRMFIEKMYLYTFEKTLNSWEEIKKIITELEKK